jgi:hypothetical protein
MNVLHNDYKGNVSIVCTPVNNNKVKLLAIGVLPWKKLAIKKPTHFLNVNERVG